ncbi:lytic murein transglycosylase [Desulfuromonas acetoxidans]|uniref:lytic murein transglycosylase n=1 Tax=Desulfuromonas acetoxidans TaxID=891 RepID=UPI0029312F70|nr:lytic murein transglycosylase [Desulfuromonas acetoxidans]
MLSKQPLKTSQTSPPSLQWWLLLAVLLLWPMSLGAATASNQFTEWLAVLRQDAIAAGISATTVDNALSGIRQPKKKVIHHDRNQPEKKATLQRYMAGKINGTRIEHGRTMLERYPTWLTRVEQRYGVPRRYLIALWGIETHYGAYSGNFSVIQALATLAYDSRRGDYFRKELLKALQILDEGHVSLARMKGSWAGAMGQCQFMPSSFYHYAIDGNKDGRIDIWATIPDIFASMANYLEKAHWQTGQTWGRQVTVPKDLNHNLIGLKTRLPLAQWREHGVRQLNDSPLPSSELRASLIAPDGLNGPTYLVYDNFRALLRWNRSHRFAITVGTLADNLVEESPQ